VGWGSGCSLDFYDSRCSPFCDTGTQRVASLDPWSCAFIGIANSSKSSGQTLGEEEAPKASLPTSEVKGENPADPNHFHSSLPISSFEVQHGLFTRRLNRPHECQFLIQYGIENISANGRGGIAECTKCIGIN
jgi:hypothetical protein